MKKTRTTSELFSLKIDLLFEANSKLNTDLMRQSYIPKSFPSTNEIGWLGHKKKFTGDKKSVQIQFDPNDPEIKDNFIYHTHPADEPSPLTAMPSIVDLETAASISKKHGVKGSTIFSGDYYTVLVPTKNAVGKKNPKPYEEALMRGDIEDALKELEKIGFDVETGKL